MIGRRSFLLAMTTLGGTLGGACSQPSAKVWRIGYLHIRSEPSAQDDGFVRALRELGYVEGRNLAIEYRMAGGDAAKLKAYAEELVRLKVDAIVTGGDGATRAAMQATSSIPIVFAVAGDPIGTGLVASLDRPGGNVTGLSLQANDLASKRMQLASELVPGVKRVAWIGVRSPIYSAAEDPIRRVAAEIQGAGRQLGIEGVVKVITRVDEIAAVLAELKREGTGLVIVQVTPITFQHRAAIAETAARERMPAMYEDRNFVDAGGLVSYGANVRDLYRRAAGHLDRILKGAKPGELPVEQPTKFELVVNAKAAKELGLSVPRSMELRADEVIQ